jgi:hypothetical protein
MEITINHEAKCECDWCGAHKDEREEMFFITPDDRAICEHCVEQNDWILTSPTGLLMWLYCQAIKLSWKEQA